MISFELGNDTVWRTHCAHATDIKVPSSLSLWPSIILNRGPFQVHLDYYQLTADITSIAVTAVTLISFNIVRMLQKPWTNTQGQIIQMKISSRNCVTEFHSALMMIVRPSSSSNGSAWLCKDSTSFFMARAYGLPVTTRACNQSTDRLTLLLIPGSLLPGV